jgi:hypothetical protein
MSLFSTSNEAAKSDVRSDRAIRALKDWIRRVLLKKTATPYECYWRDRALRAEAELRKLLG